MNIVANIKLPKLIWSCQDFENANVAFLAWVAAWGKISIPDNLRKRNVIIVDWHL